MPDERAIRLLTEALELESSSLLSALDVINPFFSWADADEATELHRLLDDENNHIRDLSDAILRLGGVPAPRRQNPRVAGLHYLSLGYLLGQLVDDKRRLVRGYAALERRAADADFQGWELLPRVRAEHEAHIESLDSLARQPAA